MELTVPGSTEATRESRLGMQQGEEEHSILAQAMARHFLKPEGRPWWSVERLRLTS